MLVSQSVSMCWTSGRHTVREGAAEAEGGRPSSSECYTDELLFRKMSIADMEVLIRNTLSQPKQQQQQQQHASVSEVGLGHSFKCLD